jgi:hypothetical protein
MKVGDLVEWKAEPGSLAMIFSMYDDRGQRVYDLIWPEVPTRLAGVVEGGIIKGFAPWELKKIK